MKLLKNENIYTGGYQFCGPGTKLQERLKNGQTGVNKLDSLCRKHDIAYSKHTSGPERKKADEILAKEAWNRVKAKDSSFGERLAALGVAGAMKAKSKFGLGLKKRKSKTSTKRKVKRKVKRKGQKTLKTKRKRTALHTAIETAKKMIREKQPDTLEKAVSIALSAARNVIKNENVKRNSDYFRVIPLPKEGKGGKIGGVLPLIPIFAGLSALGALMGGSASIANAVISSKNAKKSLEEANRHNQTMEAIAIGRDKHGNGLYLRPYKNGLGLFCAKKKLKKKLR